MTTTPDPKTVREIARKHIQSGRAEIDATIVQHFGPGLLGADEYWAWERAVEDERRKAVVTVAVSWPDEEPQEFECEVCTKPITGYPCILCEHEPDPWAAHRCDNCEGVDPGSCVANVGAVVAVAEKPQDERDLFADIADITAWLDSSNPSSKHEDAMRVMKLGEEVGEAIAAYIGLTGQNPRKGVTHTMDDLLKELADVAITALAAMQHFTQDEAETRAHMAAKVRQIISRSAIRTRAGAEAQLANLEGGER
ncbi:hypothetical protein Caci_2924 [Catenulispora acidiphila DSM 44928]|uniref:NTP pyrophosphohydrolase MazG putative catalytic core domain-containing protein n=1 Tax=Catenulispora acidiphila (strain DSM 44928 / JCM 14897 / NBRC 102108 / NRRL B-24433 / ID139908) TaxID=479433 RepID=C7Q2U1_CATAD|nr:MazG-like family protein [Catenulispora acidiphila]ACU71833.1 hypothetical protein Caci_2924 [Catenulispora acidiphila DSM 44928]